MSVADKTGAFEVLLVPRYCLFAPKHPKWPTYRCPSPNGRNTRYSPGPNWVWYHSVHPMGGPVPHFWGSIARLFPAERPKTPFWALFALPPRAVAGDHFYGPGDPPHGGNIGRGIRCGRLAAVQRQVYVEAVENQTSRFVRGCRTLWPPNDPKGAPKPADSNNRTPWKHNRSTFQERYSIGQGADDPDA